MLWVTAGSPLREAARGSDERRQVALPVGQQRRCYLPDHNGLAIHRRIYNVTHGQRRGHRTARGGCNVGTKGQLRFHACARDVPATRPLGRFKVARIHRDLDDTTGEAGPNLGCGGFKSSQWSRRGNRFSGAARPRVEFPGRSARVGPRASSPLRVGQAHNPRGAQPRADALPARCGDPQHRQGLRAVVWVEVRIHDETVGRSGDIVSKVIGQRSHCRGRTFGARARSPQAVVDGRGGAGHHR